MSRVNLPVRTSQFDPQWCNHLLGNNKSLPYNIYNYGCLLCSLVNICRLFGYNETPLTLNEKLIKVGGFEKDNGIYIWGSITKIYPRIKERLIPTPSELTDGQINEIKAALDKGQPVMVGIDYNPKTVEVDYHFSLLVDYNPNDENDFTVADTLGGVLRSLKNYLAFFKPSARKSIERYAIYSHDVQIEAPKPSTATATKAPAASGGLPENFNDIIHNSTEWEKVVKDYPTDKPAEQSSFEEVQASIEEAFKNTVNNAVSSALEEQAKEHQIQLTKLKSAHEVELQNAAQTPNAILDSAVGYDMHAVTQWANLVGYLEIDKDPSKTTFEDAKRVIAGYKSAVSDYNNKKKDAEKNSAATAILLENKNVEVDTLKKQLLTTIKLHKDEIKALTASIPNFGKLKAQYETVLLDLRSDLEKQIETSGKLRVELSEKQIESGVEYMVKKAKLNPSIIPAATKAVSAVLVAVGNLSTDALKAVLQIGKKKN